MGIFRVYFDIFFDNAGNHRATWAAFQFHAQSVESCRRRDGVDFHAPIAQILRVARDPEPLRRLTDKITEPYALHDSAHEVALCLVTLLHSRCGRQAANA
jgi:hypothetical protein